MISPALAEMELAWFRALFSDLKVILISLIAPISIYESNDFGY